MTDTARPESDERDDAVRSTDAVRLLGSGADIGRDALSVMHYCHDTYGLGHLTRTLTVARYLRDRWPDVAQLIVTGSPVVDESLLPAGADCIKLPSVVKVGVEAYEARSLPVPFGDIRDLRSDVVLSAARHFQPDLVIVDHAPAGLKGEVVPALRYLREGNGGRTRLVLGLRDVVDDAEHVRRTWAREGIYDVLETVYDRILVYGERDVYDVAREYGFSPRVAAKTCHVGYLRKHRGQRPREAVHAELGLRSDRLLVVVTAGGGEDGFHLLRAALEAIRRAPRASSFDCLLVAGPLMPAAERCRLRELAAGVPSARLVDFVPSLADCIAAADGVVSMGGYNTISEILSFERPALVVPRVAPRREQLIRAELLSRRGLVRVLHPAELTPGRLLAEMTELLERPPALRAPVALDGLSRVADELEAIAPSADRQELALSCA